MTVGVRAGSSPVRISECAPCGRTYVAGGATCVLCGEDTKDVSGHGRGRLTSWTAIHASPSGDEPYVIGWAALDGTPVGVLGRFVGDPAMIRFDLPVRVTQTAGDDGWPRLWLEPEADR